MPQKVLHQKRRGRPRFLVPVYPVKLHLPDWLLAELDASRAPRQTRSDVARDILAAHFSAQQTKREAENPPLTLEALRCD